MNLNPYPVYSIMIADRVERLTYRIPLGRDRNFPRGW